LERIITPLEICIVLYTYIKIFDLQVEEIYASKYKGKIVGTASLYILVVIQLIRNQKLRYQVYIASLLSGVTELPWFRNCA
jgi:hypothetical protein